MSNARRHPFASMEISWQRQTRAEIKAVIAGSDLEQQMRTFQMWKDWENHSRGRID